MTLLQGCLGWFKYAWIKINIKLFKNTMIFNQILSYLMIWNWYLIWPGDHKFLNSKIFAPNTQIHTPCSKNCTHTQVIHEKWWNSDKKYVFEGKSTSLSMEFMLTQLYITGENCLSPVPVFWDLAPVLTLFNVLVLLKQVSGCVYVLSRQHAGEFTLSLLHLGSKLKTQTISAIELDHQNLAQLKFQSLTIYKIIKFQK